MMLFLFERSLYTSLRALANVASGFFLLAMCSVGCSESVWISECDIEKRGKSSISLCNVTAVGESEARA